MRRSPGLYLLLLMLGGCGRGETGGGGRSEADPVPLERAAIAAGIVSDPARTDITGLFSQDTDRVCIVPAADDYRIGATVDYGPGHACNASGTAVRDGAVLHVALAPGCRFDATFDGSRIAFPAQLPQGCTAACTGRASLAALAVDRVSDVLSEAATLDGTDDKPLCGS